jgi:uncharacterized protein YcfJ
MKRSILASALAFTLATPALAEYTTDATVEDHYRIVTRNVPNTERVCETVEVPIYGQTQGRASTGDTIVGAIIGGAIGNQFGGGSGKDAMTVLGAITGADIANKRGGSSQQVITGYRQQQQCRNVTTYSNFEEEVYSHSTITWREGGRNMTLRFERR